MPTTAHCIIATPGLSNLVISPLRADSTVEIAEQESGRNLWIGLLVDGKFWPLVMWKHASDRPFLREAVQAAYTLVQDTINSLKVNPEPVNPDLGNETLPNPEPVNPPELTSLLSALGPTRRTVADIWRSLGITRKKLQSIINTYRNELALAGVNLHTATHAEAGRLSLYVNDGERRVAAISWVTPEPEPVTPEPEPVTPEPEPVKQTELPAFAALGSTRRPVATGVSFPTARTVIANTAQRNYEHWELMGKLASFGKLPPNAARMSRRSLAMRLAWVLLPGGIERVNGGLL